MKLGGKPMIRNLTWKKLSLVITYIGMTIGITACGNWSDNQVQTESIAAGSMDGTMLYEDEELGISFRIKEELYSTLICEITPQEADKQLNLEKIIAAFYADIGETRVPLFQISVFEGGFEKDYLKEKAPQLLYIGSNNGYTYALEYKENDDLLKKENLANMQNCITVRGAALGIFADEENAENTAATKIEYSREIVEQEDRKEEIIAANVKSRLGYSMKYESDFFNYSEETNKESYIGQDKEGDVYPNIYFTVTKTKDESAEEIVNDIMEKWEGKASKKNTKIGNQETPYTTTKISHTEGNEANSIVKESYVLAENEEVYLIELGFFKEAEEEYGEKLHKMLETFLLI